MKQLSILCLALALLSFSSQAAIHRVNFNGSAQYATITAAYTAASSGDTIIVSPGTYSDVITSVKRLTIIGAGWDQVTTQYFYFNTGSTGSRLEGLKVTNSGANQTTFCYLAVDSITLRRCFLYNNNVYPCLERQAGSSSKWITVEDCILHQAGNNALNADVIRTVNDSLVVRNCLITMANTIAAGQVAIDGTPRFLTFVNNTMVNVRELFSSPGNYGMYVANNIVWDWASGATWGSYSTTATFEYNASQTPAPPGANAQTLAADPFVLYTEASNYEHGVSDLHLAGGSSLIDAGVPSLLDRDGSRSDLGIYGGPYQFVQNGAPSYPFVISIVAPSAVISGDSLSVNTIGRVGPRY
jgi:hypothetical protein